MLVVFLKRHMPNDHSQVCDNYHASNADAAYIYRRETEKVIEYMDLYQNDCYAYTTDSFGTVSFMPLNEEHKEICQLMKK